MKKFIVSICLVLLFLNQLVFASSSNDDVHHFTCYNLLPILVVVDSPQKVEADIVVDNELVSKINGFENSKDCRILVLASYDRKRKNHILLHPKELICRLTNEEIRQKDLEEIKEAEISVPAELMDESEIASAQEKHLSTLPDHVKKIYKNRQEGMPAYKVLKLPANTKIEGRFRLKQEEVE